MKIGITCYPTYGGSGVVATELGIELAARGHDIHFITYSQPFRLTGREANINFHEVAVSNYPLFEHPPYDLALATRMAEVARFYLGKLEGFDSGAFYREAIRTGTRVSVVRALANSTSRCQRATKSVTATSAHVASRSSRARRTNDAYAVRGCRHVPKA